MAETQRAESDPVSMTSKLQCQIHTIQALSSQNLTILRCIVLDFWAKCNRRTDYQRDRS